MKGKLDISGYSADVRIHLNVNGFVLPVAQLAPDFIILRDFSEHPPTDAEIVMSINGAERRWAVHLPDGISPDHTRTRIA